MSIQWRQLRRTRLIVVALVLTACESERATTPVPQAARADIPPALAEEIRALAAARGVGELPATAPVRPALARLGQMLVFDKELSGNRDIACMTCHLPAFGTGDGRSLSIGQGATGLGPQRVHPDGAFIPRNAPPLFNLSALELLFWDGRVSMDATGVFHTPAGDQLTPEMTRVFEFGAVSALGLFPVLSREEMRAFGGNELAGVPDDDPATAWRLLMERLGRIPEYRRLFEQAYPGTAFDRMTFAHASNAMAGFFVDQLTFDNSPWDRFLRGADGALSADELEGAKTFLSIRCSLCHNGPAFTDNQFHNVAIAQFGPGQGDGALGNDDFGRRRVTGLDVDRYRFRTTPLHNVALTAPFGHDGAFADLRAFIDHYSESEDKLRTFDPLTLESLLQGTLLPTADAIMATRDTILDGVVLPPEIVDQLTAFMHALTDPAARRLDRLVPGQVPSGLPVDARR